jgi:serine/threonine protein kinase, bacterial
MWGHDRIEQAPEDHLAAVGTVFARFDQQDSGNVSYGVEVDGARFFVKTAGDPAGPAASLDHPRRVDLLRNAVRLGRAYRHPAMPALHRVIESPYGPVLVYDWVDGDLLGSPHDRRDDPDTAFQRFRRLPVEQIATALDTVVDVHRMLGASGEVANDFYDGCLIYDFATGKLSLVDLDHYRPGPYQNEVGRMFGSSRFMAPEEFTLGAVIDQRTTVFNLGRTVLVLLSDGSGAPGPFRGPRPLYDVAVRACQPEPGRRYESVAEFCAAWLTARAGCGAAEDRPEPGTGPPTLPARGPRSR